MNRTAPTTGSAAWRSRSITLYRGTRRSRGSQCRNRRSVRRARLTVFSTQVEKHLLPELGRLPAARVAVRRARLLRRAPLPPGRCAGGAAGLRRGRGAGRGRAVRGRVLRVAAHQGDQGLHGVGPGSKFVYLFSVLNCFFTAVCEAPRRSYVRKPCSRRPPVWTVWCRCVRSARTTQKPRAPEESAWTVE